LGVFFEEFPVMVVEIVVPRFRHPNLALSGFGGDQALFVFSVFRRISADVLKNGETIFENFLIEVIPDVENVEEGDCVCDDLFAGAFVFGFGVEQFAVEDVFHVRLEVELLDALPHSRFGTVVGERFALTIPEHEFVVADPKDAIAALILELAEPLLLSLVVIELVRSDEDATLGVLRVDEARFHEFIVAQK
jgi:hypothetical protein